MSKPPKPSWTSSPWAALTAVALGTVWVGLQMSDNKALVDVSNLVAIAFIIIFLIGIARN